MKEVIIKKATRVMGNECKIPQEQLDEVEFCDESDESDNELTESI